MARRRLLAVDTSDGLANLVLGFLAVLIVASLALIPLIGSAGEADPAEPEEADPVGEVVPAADEPAVSATLGAAAGEADEIPDEPVDDLTVEGTGSAAAGLVAPGFTDGTAGGTATTPPGSAATPAPIVTPFRSSPATPTPTPTVTPSPAVTTTPTPSPSPSPTATPTPPPDGAGAVVVPPEPDGSRYRPDDPDRVPQLDIRSGPRGALSQRVDLDGDGTPERVWSAIVTDVVQTRVDQLADGRWVDGASVPGAVADRLVALRVDDLTGDGRPEIWTRQWVATEGESITLWQYADGQLQRMDASGGCWNGSNTFGFVGALVQSATPGRPIQIAAICEDDALPWWQWPAALYRWEDGRWTEDRLVGKYR